MENTTKEEKDLKKRERQLVLSKIRIARELKRAEILRARIIARNTKREQSLEARRIEIRKRRAAESAKLALDLKLTRFLREGLTKKQRESARQEEVKLAPIARIEDIVADNYRKDGWTVLLKGIPDLFMFRSVDNKLEIRFREVKGPGDQLRPDQITYLQILRESGINAATVWVTKSGAALKQTPEYPSTIKSSRDAVDSCLK